MEKENAPPVVTGGASVGGIFQQTAERLRLKIRHILFAPCYAGTDVTQGLPEEVKRWNPKFDRNYPVNLSGKLCGVRILVKSQLMALLVNPHPCRRACDSKPLFCVCG